MSLRIRRLANAGHESQIYNTRRDEYAGLRIEGL